MEPLKHMFNGQVVRSISAGIRRHYPRFNGDDFYNTVMDPNWESRELKDRISHISHSIKEYLPESYPSAIEILRKTSMEQPLGFEQMPFPTFIELFGLPFYDESIKAIKDITKGSTCEFSIRPFLKKHPQKTLNIMSLWAKDKNEHVRRLASEGCRPRLPWGGNFRYAIENPKPILKILELLKADESIYVRKSVANNMNDISKDHPNLILEIAERWLLENDERTSWIVKKGLRTLLKQADTRALRLFGYGNPKSIDIGSYSLSDNRFKIGQSLGFKFMLLNKSSTPQKLRIEYLIDYAKKKGQSSKVFQISEFEMAGAGHRWFSKNQSLADMSTRKHYAGQHRISIRVNGVIKTSLKFELVS